MKKNKFTVIIPTRERANTLKYTIKTVLDQDYDNFEVIVCDNFSKDDTELVVTAFNDKRIRYINTGQRLSMSHNWEFALSHVSDGYVSILGDDDGLLPNCFNIVNDIIAKYDIEAVISDHAFYSWKDRNEFLSNALLVPTNINFGIKDSKEELIKVLAFEQTYYTLPSLYKGFISMSAIKRVKEKSENFFYSLNPDLYSTIALGSTIDKFYVSEIPFAINGASAHSGGSSYFDPKEGDDTPAQKFYSENNIPFDSSLVVFPSIPVMVFECYLQAKKHNLIPPEVSSNLSSALLETLKTTIQAPLPFYIKIIQGVKDNATLNGLHEFIDHLAEKYPNKPKSKFAILKGIFYTPYNYILCPNSSQNIYDAFVYFRDGSGYISSNSKNRRIKSFYSVMRLVFRYLLLYTTKNQRGSKSL